MFNGATAALSIYFYYRDVTFIVPAYIPFSLGFIMLGSTIKSALLNRYKHSIGFFNILLIGYLLQIFPLIIASDINLGLRGDAKSYTYYFMLGFYPFDG